MRLRCKFDHTFKNFLQEETKVKTLHELENEIVGNIITSRRGTVGEIVELDDLEHGEKLLFSNREVAYAIAAVYGLNVEKTHTHHV